MTGLSKRQQGILDFIATHPDCTAADIIHISPNIGSAVKAWIIALALAMIKKLLKSRPR